MLGREEGGRYRLWGKIPKPKPNTSSFCQTLKLPGPEKASAALLAGGGKRK